MINLDFKKALIEVSKLLNKNKILWALIGSSNMQLQGIDIKPHDLDLVVQLKDLKKAKEIFSKYNSSEINELKSLTNDEPAWECKFKINNVEVQILGERDKGVYVNELLKNKLIFVQINNSKIPCFTLETELQIYSKTNRKNKADLIKKFLNSKS